MFFMQLRGLSALRGQVIAKKKKDCEAQAEKFHVASWFFEKDIHHCNRW
jgi:hypothetical protein